MLDGSFSATAARLRGLRVLIAEDSWLIAKAVQRSLEDVGIVIEGVVADAIDADALACERAPELAVVDIKLRDGMAFGLIDHLHDLGIRVVVISGFSTFSPPITKASAVLQKPFGGDELVAALCDALSGRRQRENGSCVRGGELWNG
jgi:ActR/RegA family two-component response regulator